MAKDPVTYDGDDKALIRGWLDEPALGAVLAAEVGWMGFFWDLDKVDPEPSANPDSPTMFGICYLQPGGPPTRAMSSDIVRYRAALDIWLEIQPLAPAADADATRSKVTVIDRAIREHLDSKSTKDLLFNPSLALVPVKPSDRKWPRYRRLIPIRG